MGRSTVREPRQDTGTAVQDTPVLATVRLSKWSTERLPELAEYLTAHGLAGQSVGIQYNSYSVTPAQAQGLRELVTDRTKHYGQLATAQDGTGLAGLDRPTVIWRATTYGSVAKRITRHLGN